MPTYLAYLVYGLGLRRLPATRASTVATLEPVVAAALAYLVWGEALRPLGYAGAVLVLASLRLPAASLAEPAKTLATTLPAVVIPVTSTV